MTEFKVASARSLLLEKKIVSNRYLANAYSKIERLQTCQISLVSFYHKQKVAVTQKGALFPLCVSMSPFSILKVNIVQEHRPQKLTETSNIS